MKIQKNCLIEKACSGDMSRPVLHHVYLDKPETGGARLVSTNGRIAAIVPVDVDAEDVAGYLTADMLKAARKASKSQDIAYLTANGVCRMPDGQTFERPQLGKYPNVDQVIPKGETKFSLRLDPELLYMVAQAIGASRGVTLEFSADGHALRVRPLDNPRAESSAGKLIKYAPSCPDALGLIMPIAPKI